MKSILVIMLFAFASTTFAASKHVADYSCKATGDSLRQTGGMTLPGSAVLFFEEYNNNGVRVLKDVVGYVHVTNTDFTVSNSTYYGQFNFKSIRENTNYKPRKYKGYSQFKDFDATAFNSWDGGGMSGYLVIEKKPSKAFKAKYVFQAGDHMGGTLDMECTTKY